MACELSKYGVSLILWDKNVENKKTYDALRALGHRRIYLHNLDLTNETQVRETAKLCKDKHGHISMIILAATTSCNSLNTILETNNHHEERQSFGLLYESSSWIFQEFLPKMIEHNSGHLVLLSNEAAIYNLPLVSTYSSLQSAQIKLVECVNAELSSNKNNKIAYSIVYLGNSIEDINAKVIVKSILKNQPYIFFPRHLNYVNMLKSILPANCFNLLFSSNRFQNTQISFVKKTN